MKYQPFEFGTFFHVYNRAINNELLFRETENYYFFLNLTKKYLLNTIDIYSYCLLPTHFHFIIKIKEIDQQPTEIKNGKKGVHQSFSNCFNSYAKAYNKKYNRKGSLFQEHLKRELINKNDYLKNTIIYVNTNPTHHELCDYKDYEFSSYKSIISNGFTNIKRNDVLEMFEDRENFTFVLESKKNIIELKSENDICQA